MHKRLNVTLPNETIRLLDRVAKRGERSRVIAEAVAYYVEEVGKGRLRKLIKEGAIRRSERDVVLAEEWFALEGESWDSPDE